MLLEYPGLYRALTRNARLKPRLFLVFFLAGLWEGTAAYFMSFGTVLLGANDAVGYWLSLNLLQISDIQRTTFYWIAIILLQI